MKTEKIYICGKVTGLPIHEVSMKFGAAEKMLKEEGFEIINPLNVVNDWHCPWHIAMRKCIEALLSCDGVYALSCSANSKGALLELEVARALKILIIEQ